MKYFFLGYLAIILLVVGIFGFRGDKFSQPPVRIFPDMDEQDKIKAQKPTMFFEDGLGSRKPIAGTVPHSGDNGVFSVDFSAGRHDYYSTGALDGSYGNGMPEGLGLEGEADSVALLNRGKDMYGVHCAICHGDSGDGKGVVAKYLSEAAVPVAVASIHNFPQSSHPDGYLFEVISNGKGNMGGYKHNIPVRDRWAIVAYLRALQAAK
ncbi:MAG: c-type cytochrome [Akkermansiaceae bacterium]